MMGTHGECRQQGGILNYNFMGKGQVAAPGFEAEELRGFSRTVAEIEWLLVILVMLYQVVQGRSEDANAQIYFGTHSNTPGWSKGDSFEVTAPGGAKSYEILELKYV